MAFGALLHLPGTRLRRGIAGGGIAEHVRVAADHLVGNRPGDFGKAKAVFFLGHAGVIDHLKQQIAEFIWQRVKITPGYRVRDFVGFLDRIGRDAVEILHLVPRTSGFRIAQSLHDREEASEFGLSRSGHGLFPSERFTLV